MSGKGDKTTVRYVMATIIAFCIVGVYGLFALNLKIMNPLTQALKEYTITDFYSQVIGTSAERDTSRLVTIVDMTELVDRRDIAYALQEVQAQHPKVVGVDIKFEGLKPDNPEGDSLSRGGFRYRKGDRVMQIRNNYDKEVFNGDIGYVKEVNTGEKTLTVLYEGRPVEYED